MIKTVVPPPPGSVLSTLSPVIVIDDDEFFRVAIDAVLRERFGVDEVIVCGSVPEAVRQLSDGPRFGLGLVDLNLSGMDNRALLDALKAAQPGVPLVVLSASRAREDILMALSEGAHGFIHKGLGIGETERALRQIAGGSVYVPPFTPQSNEPERHEGHPRAATTAELSALTPRQREVLELLVSGKSNKAIARALCINLSTVKFHLSFIFRILGASNRVEAAMVGAELLHEGG